MEINRLERLFQQANNEGGEIGQQINLSITLLPSTQLNYTLTGPGGLNLLQFFNLLEQVKMDLLQKRRVL